MTGTPVSGAAQSRLHAPTATSPHPRFVRAGIREHPGGGVVVTTPRGAVLRIHVNEAELAGILAMCDGNRSLDEIAAQAPRPAGLRELLGRLYAEGCLTSLPVGGDATHWVRFPAAELDPSRPSRTGLVVHGNDRIASVMASTMTTVAASRFRDISYTASIESLGNLERDGEQVVVSLLDGFDLKVLREISETCTGFGLPWSYLCYADQRGWFGPHFNPGSGGPAFDDLCARRLAAASDRNAFHQERPAGTGYLPPDLEVVWMLSVFLVDLERWLAGAPANGNCHEVEIDTVRQTLSRHPVLPLPDSSQPLVKPACPATTAEDLLVDERSGIIRFVTKAEIHQSAPQGFTVMTAMTSDISRVRPWRNDLGGGGSSFGNAAAARAAAIGEAVERYCGNIIQHDKIIRSSYEDLTASGENVVDPERLVLFSAGQYESPGFPFTPIRRESVIHWYKGWSLTRQQPAWLPASLVYVNWYRTYANAGSPTNGTYYPGVAAGPTLEASLAAGLLEVVERHATMVWWVNGHALPAVRLTPELTSMWSDKQTRGWLIHLANEFSIPVMAGIVENNSDSLLTVGFAARSDAREAALKAWGEALVLQDLSRDLLNPDGKYRHAIANGRLSGTDLKPWRSDRRYLDSYRADFRDVVSLMSQAQFHLDPRGQQLARPQLEVPAELTLDDLPRLESADLTAYQDAVESRGYEIYYADITTPDIELTGLKVCRTLVPGLVPNFPAAFPFLGREAAQRAAVALGWRSSPLTAAQINNVPLPHA